MPIRKSEDFSDEELLQPIRIFFREHGKAPKTREYTKDNGFPFGYSPVYNKRFGGIPGINRAASIKSNNTKKYTRESILEIIQPVADFLGRCPKYEEIKEYSKLCKDFPGCYTVENAFDNWEDLAHSLGYTVNRRTLGTIKRQIYDIYKPISDKLGKCITKSKITKLNEENCEKYPGHSVIINMFDTWENFANFLGYERNSNPKGFWSEEKCLELIKQEANKKGRMLFSDEFDELSNNNLDFPSTATVNLHCGGVDEIATKIGHKPNLRNKSIAELEIFDYVKTLTEYGVYSGDRTILDNGYELDIYIPDINIAIEYNGNYWHNSIYKSKEYHINKTLAANNKGISLCHIWEEEWQSNQEEIKEYLFNFINNIPQEHVGIVDRMKPLNYINSTVLKYTNPKLIDVGREKCWNCGTIIYEEVKDENPSNI